MPGYNFSQSNIVVLDLEIKQSPNDIPSGWSNLLKLGLSIGCYFDYKYARFVWFDDNNIDKVIKHLVKRQPIIVSFNGDTFDFPLMGKVFVSLGGDKNIEKSFLDLTAEKGFDIFTLIKRISKPVKGAHNLDAICAANDCGKKRGDGAMAPKLWKNRKYAELFNYCQNDVIMTRLLFEKIVTNDYVVKRQEPLEPIVLSPSESFKGILAASVSGQGMLFSS